MKILVLLIGGNPIANYALVQYFKDNKTEKIPKYDKVVLIYTTQTKNLAENIKALSNVEFIDIDLKENERNLTKIKDEIEKTLKEFGNISHIHLNYTGGTKSMSIGAYLAIDSYKNIEKVYSDISPNNYKLTLQDGSIYPKDGSISDNINIPIDDFYILHNLNKPKYETEHTPFYSDNFCMFLLEKCDKDEESFFINLWDKDKKELKNLKWQQSIEKHIPIPTDDISNNKLKKLKEFICGKWLEEYLLNSLHEIKTEDGHITDIAWNVETKIKNKEFEVDVIAISGYKSFVFSCTTDKKAHIKQKAFEANRRSEQVGGRASHTILVSLANTQNIDAVKEDMKDIEKTFDAIGIEELRDKEIFKKNLKEIFYK